MCITIQHIAHHSLSLSLFILACLQAYASAKESEIRGVCSSNYQEFVDSIEEIVRMKADVAKLQRDIDRFQNELASATAGVLTIHDSLDACYRVQRNIDESIEKLQQCQRIVRLALICILVVLLDVIIDAGCIVLYAGGLGDDDRHVHPAEQALPRAQSPRRAAFRDRRLSGTNEIVHENLMRLYWSADCCCHVCRANCSRSA